MATQKTYTPSDIPNLENQISGLKSEASSLESNLVSSPTAFGGTGTPSASDLSGHESLKRINSEIQKLTDSKLRAQWYKPKDQSSNVATAGGGEVDPGTIGKVLNFIAKPLYGIVGATKHAVGQGQGSLYQDIADNMVRNRNTFSDVLKTSGVTGGVAAPLGFALDVAMDPVNWLTVGTGALIPRTIAGATKGGIKGAGIAAKSSALEKASFLGRFTPRYNKSNSFRELNEKALASTDEWEKLSGINAEELLLQKGMGVGKYRVGLADLINKTAESVPGGETFLKTLWYSPKDWIRQARIKDVLQKQLTTDVGVTDLVSAHRKGQDIAEMAPDISKIAKETPTSPVQIDFGASDNLMTPKEVDLGMAKMSSEVLEQTNNIAPNVVSSVDDAVTVLKNPEMVITDDHIENAVRMANENNIGNPVTYAEVKAVADSGALDASGVKWFDSMMTNLRSFEKKIGTDEHNIVLRGKKIMGAYDASMSIFRVAKIGLSPTAYVNGVVGNLFMTHLANGDIGPGFLKTLKLSFDFFRDKPGAVAQVEKLLFGGVDNAMRNPEMVRFFDEFKTAATGTFGLDLLDKKTYIERVLRNGKDAGLINSASKAVDIEGPVTEAINIMEEAIKRDTSKGGTSMAKKAYETGGSNLDKGTGMLSNEMFSTRTSAEMFKFVEDKAAKNPDHMGWKLLNATMNKIPSNYEKIDQVYKLTTFLRATTEGYSMNQLRQMRHIITLDAEDITRYANKDRGEYLYKLSPQSALELANVMYLNYNAMPAAVRVLRNFPLLGSPFISFMYGMALKTGQTLAYNPSAFNKVTFAMNDFGGSKTPLEKKSLESEYYSYLKQPGMFRMPFFNENPIYLNMASAIPYYSLNMFSPTQTSYGDTWREKIAGTVQKSPLLKDPAGNAIFENMILPLILGESISPQGQFGQPLYPVDATGLEKAGYGIRSLAEAYVPNVAAYAGLVTPEAVVDYIPSYRWRQLARAKEGKNQLGISSKESKTSRTLRNTLNATGIPVQAPVNISYTQGQ